MRCSASPLGSGDLADIEGRVLDHMELLRPHQLRHPELVTEGMNLLAQAAGVPSTDPVARFALYDRTSWASRHRRSRWWMT